MSEPKNLFGLLWALCFVQLAVALLWILGYRWVESLGTDSAMRLRPRPEDAPRSDDPSVVIFIAAHNEEERIQFCLRRLLSQNYGNLHVTVVDDRSDDRTAERVRGVMAQETRVSLVQIKRLPEGWIGKTHALSVAAAECDADYLLFMDCDCRLTPGALSAVMRKTTREGIDFVSLWPRLELASASERLMTPVASWLLGVWALLRAGRGSSNADIEMGNGQFLLFSREAYRRIGGHASVRSELAEDLMMAQRVARLGLPRWTGLGDGLYVTSRDNAPAQTFNSLTRVLIGSLVTPWRLLVSTQFLSGGIFSPLLCLPLNLYLARSHELPQLGWFFVAVCVVHLIAMSMALRRLSRMTLEGRSPTFVEFIGGSILCVGLVLWACLVVLGRGNVRWGQTVYRVRGSQVLCALPEAG